MISLPSFEGAENDRLILFVNPRTRELQRFRNPTTAEQKRFAEESPLSGQRVTCLKKEHSLAVSEVFPLP